MLNTDRTEDRLVINLRGILALMALAAGLSACTSPAITSQGIGGATAISHSPNGITYRTFAVPVARVKTATLIAMGRMSIRHVGTEKTSEGEVLKGEASGRTIDILLEPLGPAATRVKVIARNGGTLYDSTTAVEIISQTERLLGNA